MNVKQAINIAAAAAAAPETTNINSNQTMLDIGHMNVAAISGGRFLAADHAIVMPVSSGYHVVVSLSHDNTYTVRRVFVRNGNATVKGEWTEIYYHQLGEIAYRASCYRDELVA